MEGKKPNDNAQAEEDLRLTVAAYRAKKETGDFTDALRKLLTPDKKKTS